MGRPRKPTAVLEMSGALAKNPARHADRAAEVETSGPIGEPPEDFLRPHGDGPKLLALWSELIAQAPIGVLTFSDRQFLKKACIAGVEADRPSKAQLRWTNIYLAALKGMGMTPEGRAIRGLGAKAPKSERVKMSPLAEFQRAKSKAG